MSEAKSNTTEQPCFLPGYWAAVCLHRDTAPTRVYVGEIQAVDEHGIRLTLIDWILGRACGHDFFVPWSSIASSKIATPDHDLDLFIESAGGFQTAMKDSPPAGSHEVGPGQ